MDLRELADAIVAAVPRQLVEEEDEMQEEEEQPSPSMGLAQSGAKNRAKQKQQKDNQQQKQQQQQGAKGQQRTECTKQLNPVRRHSLCPLRALLTSSSSSSSEPRAHQLNSPPPPSPSPSLAAASLLTGWRRHSAKRRESPAEESSDSGGAGHCLSELSQDVLAQIIRLFPFPTASPRPKLQRTLSQPANAAVDCPNSNSLSSVSMMNSPTDDDDEQQQGHSADLQQHRSNDEVQQVDESAVAAPVDQPAAETAPGDGHALLMAPEKPAAMSSSSSLGRLRRAASNLSTACTPISKRERPKQLAPSLGKGPAKNGALSKLCRVSVDTMAITALPLDCWLKERLKNWVQLSGHQGTIVPASNHSLWKKQPQGSHTEAQAYEQISRDPALRGVNPKFFREIQHRNEVFIEIQDLLAEFPDTASRAVMDIKIGTRTFLESEVANRLKRADLYRKMLELAPNEPTEQEHTEAAVTKLRYMQFRERKSSSATLGFRIEAAQVGGGCPKKDFKAVCSRQQVGQALLQFLGERRAQLAVQLGARLRQIRVAVEASQFFHTHEVVGSSVLLVYDQRKAGAWLIDFAKCSPCEGRLTHRAQWQLGNHEDGYLTGLDNLIALLEAGAQTTEERSTL